MCGTPAYMAPEVSRGCEGFRCRQRDTDSKIMTQRQADERENDRERRGTNSEEDRAKDDTRDLEEGREKKEDKTTL